MLPDKYISYLLSLGKNGELPKKSHPHKKDNLYDDCFKMTEKISSKNKFIQDFVLDNKIIGRKFFNKNNEIKYIEIFKNKKLDLMGISPNITFLHSYEPKLEKEYDENNFIGFRYYEEGINVPDTKYFTLIKRYNSKYYILEKNSSINVIYDEKFENPNLDCFSIIYKIIINKYKNKDRLKNGETFPELIGFCYGLISINKFKNFICVEPLIPDLLNRDSLEENIPNELEDNIVYLEPLISDAHISLIVITNINKTRFNFILDMSRYHSKEIHLNKSIYPDSVVNKNVRFPEKPIQNYSSCCLWFYGIIGCLMYNKKYYSFESFFNNIQDNNTNFYIDVINEIAFKFYNIYELFRLEEVTTQEKIDFDRIYLNGKENNYSVHKNITFTHFLNISSFFFDISFFQSLIDYEILIDSQKILINLITFKNLLELNKNLQNNNNEADSKNIIKFIEWELNVVNKLLNQFEEKYNVEFCKYSASSYKNTFDNTNIKLPDEMKKKIDENNYTKTLDNIIKIYNNSCSSSKKKYTLYSIEQIIRNLNISNDICYQIFYK